MLEPVATGRAKVTLLPDGVEITIPERRNLLVAAFLGFWLCGWAVGEVSVLGMLMRGQAGPGGFFMLAWLGGWTIGGGMALYAWLRMVLGKERIRLRPDALVVFREVPGWVRRNEYDATQVTGLRALPVATVPFFGSRIDVFGTSGGSIAFDYGARTVRLASGLDEAEARTLVATLVKHDPRLAREAAA